MSTKRQLLTLGLLVAFTAEPCYAASKLIELVNQFDKASQQSSTVLSQFYGQMNEQARDFYFDKLLFDPKLEMVDSVTTKSSDGQDKEVRTGLLEKFTAAQIRTRLERISIVTTYSHLLAQLADPEEAKKAEGTLLKLGQTIESLNTDIQKVAGSESKIDSVNGIGAATKLYSFFKGAWKSWKGDKIIRSKIQECAPLINPLIKDLLDDAQYIKTFYRNGLETRFSKYSSYYKKHLLEDGETGSVLISPTNIGGRAYFLNQAEQATASFVNPKVADPSKMLMALQAAHEQLVLTAAGKNNNKETLDSLSLKLADYTNKINQFATDLKALENARHQ